MINEKIRIPMILDTVLVDGLYLQERRSQKERRRNKIHWLGYERRVARSPRRHGHKPIDEEV
ncbi:hypothetical protein [Vibrio sp. CAU 1672]|uniref:hypothetical protein n=1 Tax=Vibrio sp. CAU 1672 TaxID=3032594 RepID=UPI0023DB9386|nr:hypothetical protein [Vibrio sp. CAU 1672]MDF2153573.1 hypothetical protein [Vibrio sp. CAU 1672]